MKVLYLIDTLAVGGSEISLLEILRRFDDIQPTVCHIFPGDALRPAFEAANIPVISLNIPAKNDFRRAIGAVTSLVRSHRPDLLHTTLFRADIVGRVAGRLTGTPVISSFVNEAYHPDRWRTVPSTVRFKLKTVQVMDRLTARWAHHFFAVSESAKEANCRALGVPLEKVSVIYRGREPGPFLGVSDRRVKALRTDLELPEQAPVLLNVGRLLQRKGQEELVRSLPLVLREFPEARLLIAGEGQDRAKLAALIEALKLGHAVRLLGTRKDIPDLLNLADLFIFTSHYEGHPGSLVEAMLAGRPILASDISVHRECISHGDTGLLVPVGDEAAIGQSIVWMLKRPAEAQRLGERAQATALDRFQIDQIAARHEKLYRELL